MKIFLFPQLYFGNFENVFEDLEINIDEILDFMEREFSEKSKKKDYNREDLVKIYHGEKEIIKESGYRIVSSYFVNNFTSVKNIVKFICGFAKKHIFDVCFQIDLILYNKINLFLKRDFRDDKKIFILKSFPFFEYLSTENIKKTNLDFCIHEVNGSDISCLDMKIFLNKLKKEAEKNDLRNDIFFVSNGFFSIDKKEISIFLMKTKIL